ncbi:hypothetical protein [Glaciecola petra]|uniref:Uncharacterized protein n=1 Tax=Glaciecola petra TaxID=3075602 RepID=A0ABU2ZM34_9ALTE|nr:hypothetical protein [Aestuariibacter sp. P117]MDT0593306.1 hypothetical protein [Aestuariibacter sp. P117]
MAKDKILILLFTVVLSIGIGILAVYIDIMAVPLICGSILAGGILLSAYPNENSSNFRIMSYLMSLLFLPLVWAAFLIAS